MSNNNYSLEEFGQRIKAVRRRLNMTQKEFSEAVDLSVSFISDIESGRSKACLDFFYNLARKFNINLNYLILGQGEIIDTASKHPSMSHKKIGQSIDSINELLWYTERSPMMYHTILGFASRFIHENRKYLIKEIKENKETKSNI
jgi:transcriptional regulator with XRE-family HTH domain